MRPVIKIITIFRIRIARYLLDFLRCVIVCHVQSSFNGIYLHFTLLTLVVGWLAQHVAAPEIIYSNVAVGVFGVEIASDASVGATAFFQDATALDLFVFFEDSKLISQNFSFGIESVW